MFRSCYKCERRYPGCHDHCEDYAKDKVEHDRIRDIKYRESATRSALIEGMIRVEKNPPNPRGRR